MEHIGLGASPLRFTAEGIRIVEASLDRPNEPHGPFPAWNVVIGNVHGSQIAIGSGTFTQSHSSDQALDLQHLTDLIKAATATWESDAQSRAAGSAALIEAEARSPAPETSLIMAAAQKIGTVALSVGGNVATAALVAYLKVKGILPP
jgi:hypothetical protein